MRRASHSREAGIVPLMTSFAITGTATGREISSGSRLPVRLAGFLCRPWG